MSLVYDLSPEQTDLGPVLRRRLSKDAADYLTECAAEVRREHEDLGKSSEFAVEIRYSLGIEKRADSGDITLTAGLGGRATRSSVPAEGSRLPSQRRSQGPAERDALRRPMRG